MPSPIQRFLQECWKARFAAIRSSGCGYTGAGRRDPPGNRRYIRRVGYHILMFTLRQLVEALEARTLPRTEDSALDSAITHVASADAADSASLVFAESAAALSEALACPAAAVLVTDALAETAPSSAKPMIIVKQSRLAFARAARL